MKTIVIPERFVDLCCDWHGGTDCMLYAVASTGTLIIGSIRPTGCDTLEQWHYTLWRNLSADVAGACRAAIGRREDHAALVEFEDWVDCVVDQLSEEYGLADWEG